MAPGMRTVLLGAGIVPLVVKYLRDEPVPMGPVARQNAPGSFVRLRHGITHYEIAGPDTGEPVLFISGATLSQWIWDGLFDRVAAAGTRAIRYDRYGMEFSDRPTVEYDYDLFEAQILELLDRLGVDRPVTIVALAFGGPIAAEFAVRNPQRVAGVCMIAPDGFGVPISLGLKIAMLPVIGEPFFKIIGDRALTARIPGYSADHRVVAQVAARFRPEFRYRGFKRALLSALRHIPIHSAEYLYRHLNTRGIPLQIIWGANDRVTPAPSQELVTDVFSNADIHFLDGVGHLPHFEQPETTSTAITEFITGHGEQERQLTSSTAAPENYPVGHGERQPPNIDVLTGERCMSTSSSIRRPSRRICSTAKAVILCSPRDYGVLSSTSQSCCG